MSRSRSDILWSARCRDRNAVGGKAAALGELADHWPVPPFFCLTATGAANWSGNPERVPLHAAYATLMGDDPTAVAVRSSAIGEDGERASFAGQYESILDVVGYTALCNAVARCLRSADTARTAAYRRDQNATEAPTMAVIVQRQVQADASVVAFSVDPTTGDGSVVVVNAVWGFGEGVVGGALTPDTFAVRRGGCGIAATVSEKAQMVVATGEGLAWLAVPDALQRYPSLTLKQVRSVALMVEDLEARVGRSVDVECCFEGDRLHLLQCRPITTLDGWDVTP